jgi:hypothetical protein
MVQHSLRRWGVAGTVGLVVGLLGLWQATVAGSASPSATAAKRSTLRVNTTASLTLTRKSGTILYERGTASGTPSGTVTARFDTARLTRTTGTMTLKPYSGGSITVTAVVYPSSVGTVARFTGTFAVSGGSGRYSRVLGSGTLTGTVNRRTWAVSATARGTLTY